MAKRGQKVAVLSMRGLYPATVLGTAARVNSADSRRMIRSHKGTRPDLVRSGRREMNEVVVLNEDTGEEYVVKASMIHPRSSLVENERYDIDYQYGLERYPERSRRASSARAGRWMFT